MAHDKWRKASVALFAGAWIEKNSRAPDARFRD